MGHLFQARAHRLAEQVRLFPVNVCGDEGEDRVRSAPVHAAGKITGRQLGLQVVQEREAVVAQKAHEGVQLQQLLIRKAVQADGVINRRVPFRLRIHGHGIRILGKDFPGDRGVGAVLPAHILFRVSPEGLIKQRKEGFRMLEFAVQVNDAVAGVVERFVVVDQFLPGQFRHGVRIAALVVGNDGAGEHEAALVHVRLALLAHGAQHFGIHRALDGERPLLLFQAVAPRLLPEQAFLLEHHGMEHRVGVEIRIPEQLRFRQAGTGIGRHPGVGGRVHVGIVGLVAQIEKQAFRRILFRPAQCGMLVDVRKPRIVHRVGLHRDIEHPVGVIIGDIAYPGARFIVHKGCDPGVDELKGPHGFHCKPFHFLPLGVLGHGRRHCQEHQNKKNQFFHGYYPFCDGKAGCAFPPGLQFTCPAWSVVVYFM